jgi:hypothetical protein
MHLAGFLVGVAMLLLGVVPISFVILGGERLANLIYPPFWLYYAGAAFGATLMWLSLPRREAEAG